MLSTPATTAAARLLGLPEKELMRRLQIRLVTVHNDTITVPLGAAESMVARDTLVRCVYGNLFAWIVAAINASFVNAPTQFCIGMLDLAGFENLSSNGFEQLCINSANERLQSLCDYCTIDREQQMYELEGLVVAPVTKPDRSSMQVK